MSDASATLESTGHTGTGTGKGQSHPTDKMFVQVAIALGVITAVEVAWSYLPWGDATGLMAFAEVGGLLFMMAIKFVVVASRFMHLKFDQGVLSRLFYFGLLLAILVYVATLTTFEMWSPGSSGFTPSTPFPHV
ncbi:MAG: cytochrome C oxidase subunit IV family protein [Aquihabitans sp.]